MSNLFGNAFNKKEMSNNTGLKSDFSKNFREVSYLIFWKSSFKLTYQSDSYYVTIVSYPNICFSLQSS